MELTHLGHSCLLVETGGSRILIDPGAFTAGFEELADLDAICVTHQHVDHLDVERLPALLRANPDARVLAEPETAARLRDAGVEATTLRAGESAQVGAVRLEALGGRHAVIHESIPRIGNIGLVLRADDEPTLFHPGDAYDTVPGAEQAPEGVDVLAVPLNAPWAALAGAAAFVRAVRPGLAVPVHDALLSPVGRAVYLRLLGGLLPEGTALRSLAGEGAVALT